MSKGNGSAGRASAGGFNATAEVNAAIDRNLSEADLKARDVGKVMAFVNNSDNGVKVNGYYRTAMDSFDSYERQVGALEKGVTPLGVKLSQKQIIERREALINKMSDTLSRFVEKSNAVLEESAREVAALTRTTNRASFESKQMVIDVHSQLKDLYSTRESASTIRFKEIYDRLIKIK